MKNILVGVFATVAVAILLLVLTRWTNWKAFIDWFGRM